MIGPSAAAKLTSEEVRRQGTDHLLLSGLPPRWWSDHSAPIRLCVQELGDERRRFIARELASGLTLGEPHRPAGVAKVRMSGVLQESQKLPYLCGRGRWT